MADSDFEKDMEKMNKMFSRLKHEYDLFFAGNRKDPPFKEAKDLEVLVRSYRNAPISKLAQQFRLSSFLSSYTLQVEKWNKWMRDREEGFASDPRLVAAVRRGRQINKELDKGHTDVAVGVPEKPGPGEAPPARTKGDAVASEAPTRKLYEEFLSAKMEVGENADMGFDDFKRKLDKQRESILQKYKGQDVAFTVSLQDGKVSLKAKVRKSSRPEGE